MSPHQSTSATVLANRLILHGKGGGSWKMVNRKEGLQSWWWNEGEKVIKEKDEREEM